MFVLCLIWIHAEVKKYKDEKAKKTLNTQDAKIKNRGSLWTIFFTVEIRIQQR